MKISIFEHFFFDTFLFPIPPSPNIAASPCTFLFFQVGWTPVVAEEEVEVGKEVGKEVSKEEEGKDSSMTRARRSDSPIAGPTGRGRMSDVPVPVEFPVELESSTSMISPTSSKDIQIDVASLRRRHAVE